MNPEDRQYYEDMIKSEIAKQQEEQAGPHPLRGEAFSLAGGAVGAGLGLASINAVEEVKQQSALRSAQQENMHRDALRKLKDIHDGRADWSSVNPEAESALREMYEQNKEILSDDIAYKKMMNQMGAQKVHVINPGTRMDSFKRALPNVGLLDNLGHHLKNPAVSVGGLAGMTAGYYASRIGEK